MVLDASLLNTQHYKVRIKGKVVQSRKGVAPLPTPWCSSYRKGSLRVTLDYGRQLYIAHTLNWCATTLHQTDEPSIEKSQSNSSLAMKNDIIFVFSFEISRQKSTLYGQTKR